MNERPHDSQLANIIDKLAKFVARNGPEFEQMTKNKQKDNLQFAFLQQHSEYFNYYQFKVMEERRNLASMPQQPLQNFQPQQHIWSSAPPQQQQPPPINFSLQIETVNAQQIKLRDQIMQSEKNLQAQHQVLLQQQKSQIEDAIAKAQDDHISRCAQENQIALSQLEEKLQPIVASCTKESIQNGKLWILQQTSNSSAKSQIISQYILKKAMSSGAVFEQKLHLIYLINDVLHHCARKNVDDLKNALESVVIPMYCHATISANEEQKDKLNKLLTLWSSKANFFDSCAITKLQSPPSSLQEYQNTLLTQYASVITPLSQATKAKFDNYQQQHQAFVKHASNQITILEAEKQKLEQQSLKQTHHLHELAQNTQQVQQMMMSNLMIPQQPPPQQNLMFNLQKFQNQQQNFQPPPQQQQDMNSQFQNQNFNLPPPNFPVPDFSRPPPGFANSSEENSPPQAEPIEEPDPQAYFVLPAGLMVPLIELESCSYRGLDPDRIRVQPITAPTEKLLSAVEAFYAPPSHERPRDTEGWEKLGLYEYFKVKNAVRKQKEEAIARGEREKTKSSSPIPEAITKSSKKQKRQRIYRSKSPEGRISRSKSRSKSPEMRPSITPTVTPRNRNRKRSRSPSPSPYRHFNRETTRIDRRKRSVTPPSFIGAVVKTGNEFIDEGNKGHQMLKKLGWTSGRGLGSANNQGISEPISGGEVRDRSELYKGVGMGSQQSDPYENFRKNRSNNFVIRMKSRGEEKN